MSAKKKPGDMATLSICLNSGKQVQLAKNPLAYSFRIPDLDNKEFTVYGAARDINELTKWLKYAEQVFACAQETETRLRLLGFDRYMLYFEKREAKKKRKARKHK